MLITLVKPIYSNAVDKTVGVLCDQIGELEVYQSKKTIQI